MLYQVAMQTAIAIAFAILDPEFDEDECSIELASPRTDGLPLQRHCGTSFSRRLSSLRAWTQRNWKRLYGPHAMRSGWK